MESPAGSRGRLEDKAIWGKDLKELREQPASRLEELHSWLGGVASAKALRQERTPGMWRPATGVLQLEQSV